MMRELWRRGHRNIAICANRSYLVTHRWFRVNGFLDTLRELSGKDSGECLYSTVERTVFEAKTLLSKILVRQPKVTAIVTDCDDLAYLLLAVAKQLKLSCEKVVITGFGNVMGKVPGANEYLNLPNVEQNPFHLGATACNDLLDLIEHKIPDQPIMQYIDVELVNLDAIPVIKRAEP